MVNNLALSQVVDYTLPELWKIENG